MMPRVAGALMCLLVLTPAIAAAQTESPPAPVRIVIAFQEAWNTGSAERVLPFFSDDAVVIDPQNGGTFAGRDAVARWIADQLGRQTRFVTGADYAVTAGLQGETVRWTARLSTSSSRSLRAPPLDAAVESVVRQGLILSYAVAPDAASLARQRAAVRDTLSTRTALVDRLELPTGPGLPTATPPARRLPLPGLTQPAAGGQLPWLAIGAASLLCVALAAFKRPTRL